MPRLPRLHVPGAHYHVILRGNHREALFGCSADRDALNDIVADVIGRFDARLHAFCWMTNHLHALDPPARSLDQHDATAALRHPS